MKENEFFCLITIGMNEFFPLKEIEFLCTQK